MNAENCLLSLGVKCRLKCYDVSSRPWHRTKNNTTCHKLFATGLICLLKNDTRCPYFQNVYILFWVTVRCEKKKIKSASKLYCPEFHLSGITQACPVTLGLACWGYLQPESLTEIRLTFIYDARSDYQSGQETLVAAGIKMLHNFLWKVRFLFEEDENLCIKNAAINSCMTFVIVKAFWQS